MILNEMKSILTLTFAGNKVEAYGGTISFTLGHSEYNSLGLGNQVQKIESETKF